MLAGIVKDVLASELVVSWRSKCMFGLSAFLCGKTRDWYVLLYNSSTGHHLFSAHRRQSVPKDDRVGSCLIDRQALF